MEIAAIVGLVLITVALALIGYLTFWSRRTIERIAKGGFGTARDITRGMRGDR